MVFIKNYFLVDFDVCFYKKVVRRAVLFLFLNSFLYSDYFRFWHVGHYLKRRRDNSRRRFQVKVKNVFLLFFVFFLTMNQIYI